MSSMTGQMGYGGSQASMPKEKIPSGYKKGSLNQLTPEQMNLFSQSFAHVSPDSYTSRLANGDQSAFAETEAPAMRQFQELQGQNASRFSGMGMGARRGSGFQNEMNQATSNFAQDLASRRMDMRRQALQDLTGMTNQLLGVRPQENFLIEKQQKTNPWLGAAGAATGAAGGLYASGGDPMTALKWSKFGYEVGNGFGGM